MTAPRLAPALCAIALGLGLVLLLAAGPAPQLNYPADTANYLDACYRTALGQWLGRDYTSPIGPAAILPAALAMRLGQHTVGALVTGSVLVWLSGGLLAWWIARPRMSEWLAGGFALFTAGTAAAPYTLDFGSWRILSYGMLYNRLAWAALGLAAAAVLLPRRDGREPRGVPLGLGAGSIWLWLLKPNYLLILFPLVVFHWLGAVDRLAWFRRSVIGAAGMLAFVWLCVPFSPAGYVATHLGMARVAPASLLQYTLERSLTENIWLVLGLLLLWGAVLRDAVTLPRRLSLGLTIGAVIACTFAANLANCQFSEIPFWGALGWLAAVAAGATQTPWLRRTGLLAGLCFGLAFTWQPLASIGYNFAWKHYRAPGFPPAVEVASLAWQGMPMRPVPGDPAGPAAALESAGNYTAWLNDGLALVHQMQPGPVLCLDWSNPFPFATGTAPVPGDAIAWHVGRTHGPRYHPDVALLVAGAAAVMEPRRSLQPDSLAFKRTLFGPALAADFVLAGETVHWRLWVRKPMPGRSW
jgi:hypothetical protein